MLIVEQNRTLVEVPPGATSDNRPYDSVQEYWMSHLTLLPPPPIDNDTERWLITSTPTPPTTSVQTLTCGCQMLNNGPCSSQFPQDQLVRTRTSVQLLSKTEKDLTMLGIISVLGDKIDVVCSVDESGETNSKKSFHISNFMYQNRRVCKTMFCYVYDISYRRLDNLILHYTKNGLTPRKHGNTVKTPHNKIDEKIINGAIEFISNFAYKRGQIIPGHVKNFTHKHQWELLSGESKASVYREYQKSTHQPISMTLFCDIWKKNLPYIKIKEESITIKRNFCFAKNVTNMRNGKSHAHEASQINTTKTTKRSRCRNCDGCQTTINCLKCGNCLNPSRKKICTKRKCQNLKYKIKNITGPTPLTS